MAKIFTNIERVEKEFFPRMYEEKMIKRKCEEGGSAGKCPHCGKEMVKHIIKEGARYHVTSCYKGPNGALSHCSEPNCEHNHGPGHCIPIEKDPMFGLSHSERIKKNFKSGMCGEISTGKVLPKCKEDK
jgi:hypothetical protein